MPPKVKIQGSYSYQGEKSASVPRIAAGFLVAVIVIVLASNLATQYMAQALHYSPALGEPMTWVGEFDKSDRLGEKPYYAPHKVWRWLFLLLDAGAVTSEAVLCPLLILLTGILAAAAILCFACSRKRAGGKLSNVHGSARWAKKQDLIEAGLLPRLGAPASEVSVYTGGWYDPQTKRLMYLTHGGPEHVLAFAPTRSGKGVGLVIPSLLRWSESVLVYDVKGENLQLTAGWRTKELNSIVIRLDPTDPDAFTKGTSGTFNPLAELPLDYDHRTPPAAGKWPPMEQIGSGETAAIQNLATMIVDPDGKGLEDHWSKTAHSLIVGCITHLLYAGKREGKIPCLADVASEFTKPGITWRENIGKWQTASHLGETEMGPLVHPVVNNAAQEMINREDKEASSVLSTVVSYLTLYRDPVIARNTSRSTFRIKDLMNHEKPVSLYFVVKPVDKDRIRPFVRLFITQVIRRLADSMEFKDGEQVRTYKHRLLLMLDEFPSLGRLQIFEEALAFIAGYGLKSYLIIQDIAQLHKIYGKDEAITGNCHVKIAYATSNPDTARYLSESSGLTTVVKEAESVSKDRGTLKRNISMSLQEVSRPLLTVDECMRLKGPEKDTGGRILTPGDMLIFVAGYAAVYGRQMLYFLDPEFRRRAKINAPEMSGRTIENTEVIETGNPDPIPSLVAVSGKTEPDEPTSEVMRELIQLGAIDAAGIEDIGDSDLNKNKEHEVTIT
jgi:type IV secretion system protein VirD4